VDEPGARRRRAARETPGASALIACASAGSDSALSTAVCAAELTIRSGLIASTVAASASGFEKSAA
jgi:hypothetical protein